ncbi:MAG: hypothetical protein R2822_23465 [Spirosomataceae bacterium]
MGVYLGSFGRAAAQQRPKIGYGFSTKKSLFCTKTNGLKGIYQTVNGYKKAQTKPHPAPVVEVFEAV